MSAVVVASRFVHTSIPSRPSMSGRTGSDPVAMTTWSASSSSPSASARPGPASRAAPLITVAPACSYPPSWSASSRWRTIQSRYSRSSGQSSAGVATPAQQGLGRDARPVRALPADQLSLHDCHPPPGVQQPPGGRLPAGTHANGDHIEPVHLQPPVPSGSNRGTARLDGRLPWSPHPDARGAGPQPDHRHGARQQGGKGQPKPDPGQEPANFTSPGTGTIRVGRQPLTSSRTRGLFRSQ